MKFKALILTIALLAGTALAQKSGPVQTVRSFYTFNNARNQAFDQKGLNVRKSWFSPALTRLFENELRRERDYLKKNPTDKPHFDAFPFVPEDECYRMGKFYPDRLVFGAGKTSANRSTVSVKFYLSKVCGGDFVTTYKVEVKKVNGRWLIDDWIYDDGSRLTDDLKRAEY